MASEEPVGQGETRCSLPREACYGRVLLGMEMGMGKQYGMQESQVRSFIPLVTRSSNKDANIEVIANQGICNMLRMCNRSK